MMRTRIVGRTPALTGFVALAATMAALAAAPAQDNRQMGGVGITVYENPNFGGRNATFRNDVPDLTDSGMNDRISSLRVAPNEMWELCEHANYKGRCQVFSGIEGNLHPMQWNDIVSSLRRVRGNGSGRGGWGSSRAELQLFDGTRYTGRSLDFSDGADDLRRYGFNDRAMSLRLRGNRPWQICRDINFRNCVVIYGDVVALEEYNLERQVSSLRPVTQSGWNPGPPTTGDRLLLYEDRNYNGQYFSIERNQSSLQDFANRAQSVRVVGNGVWELCDRSQFEGRCVTVSSDVQDLGRLGMRNRVVSVRRRR
jgi:hypothetical protein